MRSLPGRHPGGAGGTKEAAGKLRIFLDFAQDEREKLDDSTAAAEEQLRALGEHEGSGPPEA